MKNRSIIFAKFLIFCSIIPIFVGIYIDINAPKYFDPVKDVMPLNLNKDDDTLITTVDDDTLKNSVIYNNDLNKEVDYNTSVINNDIAKEIEKLYGIKVLYGSQTDGYITGKMSTNSLRNSNDINAALTKLKYILSLYPEGFFQEISETKLNLTIYLIKNYSYSNVTGVTDFKKNNVSISIATDYPIEDSINHELYHYIEYYIELNGGNFLSWNGYNPAGFTYGQFNSEYSFNKTLNSDSYFVNNYAQTNGDEDRASTFEYMTGSTRYSCFDSTNYPILKKSIYISTMIDTYFDTVKSDTIEYWEKYIY